MLTISADTLTVRDQFADLNSLLLKVMSDLSRVDDPTASVAVQDLSHVTNALQLLQNDVSGYLHTGQNQLTALVGVGHIINSSLGLEPVLDEVMDTIIALMRAERGFLMLRDEGGEFSIKAARGMDHVKLESDTFAASRTIVRRVASTGEPVLTTNAQEDPRFGNQASIVNHNLRSILCVPLKLKNEIIGVIFLDSRVHTALFQKDDLEMLSAFADQAAVAIDNARLFDNLQGANAELTSAYEATLNGWVHALDLRDKETEGHTQRVTALTLVLAKEFGIKEPELVHIKRGALLHDIGKMAIPDGILLKPGELTLAERKYMELHPIFAYDMLKPIEFLHPAIDIPYCHHEKWDGSGYPQNLRGKDIPFAARIFAIVDVWDALTSNRPYRKPLDTQEVRQHIRERSGSHFDPLVVEAFLGLKDLPVSRIGGTQALRAK
jgi:HD-GYP domain-containing protein (c-di-GMP phosphodiesterase class II)